MKIDKNAMVSLIYQLREKNENGRILEELNEGKPLKFLYGSGRLLPAFEANIYSLSSGDSFSFLLDSENAYGSRREEMIIDIPISVFEVEGKVDEEICRVGNEVPMVDGTGNPFYGVINEILADHVKMDFNHAMAGIDLFFSGKILEVREADEAELNAMNSSCSGCSGHDHSTCEGSCN
jgi:FKBP-type peptidyl-prolyl cis-trans isomerase SlyD